MQIKPQLLRRLRREHRLSQKELAEKSKVSLKQIQRIESRKQSGPNVRGNTVKRLAEALEVSPTKLVEEPPIPGFNVVRIGARLFPGVRLAYALIERRYGVNAGTIINLAPVLFALLAEGSLAWRRAELDRYLEAVGSVRDLPTGSRLTCALHAYYADQDAGYEAEAIEQRKLFDDPYPDDYEFARDDGPLGGPFEEYLRKLAADIDQPGVIDFGGTRFDSALGLRMYYSVCAEDLAKLAPPNSDALYALHSGEVRLQDIPAELMEEGAAKQREAWLQERLSPESREWLAKWHALEAVLGDPDAEAKARESAGDAL